MVTFQIIYMTYIFSLVTGSDIKCNYVNVGGVGMPIDYCMQTIYKNYNIAIRWKCNSTWNGINMEIYRSTNCDSMPLYVQSYTSDVPGFQCVPEYATSSCNEVSINAYVDNDCKGDAMSELRLITDECLLYDENIYVQLACTNTKTTMYIYNTPTGQCDDEYLQNTTALTEGSLDGETAGCILVEGCLTQDSLNTKNKSGTQIIGYVFVSIVGVVFIVIIVVFAMRYLHKKKMDSIADVAVAAESVTHSGKVVKNPYGQLNETNQREQTDENVNVATQNVNVIMPNVVKENNDDALLQDNIENVSVN
eukprot:288227_1